MMGNSMLLKNRCQMLSIIVPFYNAEKDIESCVHNLVKQDCGDVEFIFVNDGSTDSSLGLFLKTIEDSRIENYRLVNKERNEGSSRARKSGLNVANGDYVCFLDVDDHFEEGAVNRMLADIGRNFSDVYVYDYSINKNGILDYVRVPDSLSDTEYLHDLIIGSIPGYLWGKVFRKSLFEDIIFPDANYMEDLAISVQLFSKKPVIKNIHFPIYEYNISNPFSLTNSGGKKMEDTMSNLMFIEGYLKENGLESIYREELTTRVNIFKTDELNYPDRNFSWLFELYPESNNRILKTEAVSKYRRFFMWLALNDIRIQYHVLDIIKRFVKNA